MANGKLSKKVEALERKIQHLEAMLRAKEEKGNKVGTHFYPILGISKGSLSPKAAKYF